VKLADLNRMPAEGFVAALGEIFEHSPWVAAGAAPGRPYAGVDALHRAMVAVVAAAGRERQLALIRAHPELAGKAAIRGELAESSKREQAGAGLAHCSPAEFARMQALNQAYTERFGFPFIIAVKGLDRAAIIARFAERVANDPAVEFDEALAQIAKIARLRLDAMFADG
jgi:2-oxo-4-hydroxy-4-carboxy-5-ureidoimidazoline decarboxylase